MQAKLCAKEVLPEDVPGTCINRSQACSSRPSSHIPLPKENESKICVAIQYQLILPNRRCRVCGAFMPSIVGSFLFSSEWSGHVCSSRYDDPQIWASCGV